MNNIFESEISRRDFLKKSYDLGKKVALTTTLAGPAEILLANLFPPAEASGPPELLPKAMASFFDRETQLVYDFYGITPDHQGFFINPERTMSLFRTRTVFIGRGIDFSGLDPKFAEYEKWVVATSPTTTAPKIEEELVRLNSPLTGLGKFIYDLGVSYGVDSNFFMAFCYLESLCATVPGIAVSNFNPGSLRHSRLAVGEKNGFAVFNSWETGIIGWYELLSKKYFMEWGKITVGEIMPIYAPPEENDTEGYTAKAKNRLEFLRDDQRLKAEALGI